MQTFDNWYFMHIDIIISDIIWMLLFTCVYLITKRWQNMQTIFKCTSLGIIPFNLEMFTEYHRKVSYSWCVSTGLYNRLSPTRYMNSWLLSSLTYDCITSQLITVDKMSWIQVINSLSNANSKYYSLYRWHLRNDEYDFELIPRNRKHNYRITPFLKAD